MFPFFYTFQTSIGATYIPALDHQDLCLKENLVQITCMLQLPDPETSSASLGSGSPAEGRLSAGTLPVFQPPTLLSVPTKTGNKTGKGSTQSGHGEPFPILFLHFAVSSWVKIF